MFEQRLPIGMHGFVRPAGSFLLAKDLATTSIISDAEFVIWIAGKYGLIGKRPSECPILIFLSKKHVPASQGLLLKTVSVLQQISDCRISQRTYSILNLDLHLTLNVADNGKVAEQTLYKFLPGIDRIRKKYFLSASRFLLHKYESNTSRHTLYTKRDIRILTHKLDVLAHKAEDVPLDDQEQSYFPGLNEPRHVTHRLGDEGGQWVLSPNVESGRFYKSPLSFRRDDSPGRQLSVDASEGISSADSQSPTMADSMFLASENSMPIPKHRILGDSLYGNLRAKRADNGREVLGNEIHSIMLGPNSFSNYPMPTLNHRVLTDAYFDGLKAKITGTGRTTPVDGTISNRLSPNILANDLMPTLSHPVPVNVVYEDRKTNTANIEKKVIETEVFPNRSRSINPLVGSEQADMTFVTNGRLNNLANKVYQMLERKIKIEKERRGL